MKTRQSSYLVWIPQGDGAPVKALVKYLTNSSATVVLFNDLKLPEQFDIFFTADGKVARTCTAIFPSPREYIVSFDAVGTLVPTQSTSIHLLA
jgi:hypothetical protein